MLNGDAMKKLKVLLLLTLSICMVQAWADPPARVGRIAYVEGNVEFHDLASGDDNPAALNWPVTSNTMLATGRRSRVEVRVGSAAVRLDENTELEIVRLDDTHMVLQLNRGSAIADIRDARLADEFEFDTPQGRLRLDEPSSIRVDVDASDADAVQVFSGRARYDNADSGLPVSAGHRMEVSQGDIHLSQSGTEGDDFDEWSEQRSRRETASASVRYVSPETTGYEELDRYGGWQTTAEYGALWYPYTVPAGWAPYREGRWAWVQPWGWTWVDNAPWGYAPSHYGRWVQYRNRWCWAPGTRVAQPVWAPALVGWVGGNNWSVSFSAGSAPAVGWFPLAPHEVYVPSYTVSPTYIRQINMTHVARIDNITYVNGQASVPMRTAYRNRGVREAVTVMPRERFERNSNVALPAGLVHGVTEQAWRNAPVSPTMPAAIAQHSYGRNRENPSARYSVTREVVMPAAQARVVSTNPSPRFSEPVPAEMHRHMQETRPWPQAGRPYAPVPSTPAISHTVVLPQEHRIQQQNAAPAMPPRMPMQPHEAPPMRPEPPHPPVSAHEEHRSAQPYSGVQPGSIDITRIHEAPAGLAVRPPPSQSRDADHHEEKKDLRQPEGNPYRHER